MHTTITSLLKKLGDDFKTYAGNDPDFPFTEENVSTDLAYLYQNNNLEYCFPYLARLNDEELRAETLCIFEMRYAIADYATAPNH